ncbi:hypothetical protein BH10BAC4_BH10BAC4_01790 [soil metagenome]
MWLSMTKFETVQSKTIESVLINLGLISLLLASSSSGSKITGSWKSNRLVHGYATIMLTALTGNIEAKRTIENDLTLSLQDKGVVVTKSTDAFPPSFTYEASKEDMLKKIRQEGTDAILTVTLVDKQTESRYVPGTYSYAPMPMYNRFWGYYNYWGPMSYSPNYYVQDKIYYLETNVFDADSEELVWSAESQTYNPEDLSGFSEELANILAVKLEKDGIIIGKPIRSDKKLVTNNK